MRLPMVHTGRARRLALFALLGALAGRLVEAQPAPSTLPADTTPPRAPAIAPATIRAVDTAALVLQGRTIAVFRAPLGALDARERAAAAARRIEAIAEATADSARAPEVRVRRIPQGLLLVAAGRPVLTLTPADTDPAGEETIEQAAARAVASLRAVLAGERERRSVAHLARALAASVVATLLFFAVLRLVGWLRRLVLARLPRVAKPHLHELRIAGFALLTTQQLRTIARRVADLLAWAAGLFAAYVWLAFVLTRFVWSRPWGEALGGYLAATVRDLALTAVAGIPGLFAVVLIVVVTRWVTRLVGAFFGAVEAGTVDVPWMHRETANPTRRIAAAGIWLLALVVAYPYIPGSGSDIFKGVSVFAGLVLSLGSSGLVNQTMSGLVLMYSRALRPGDFVRIGETEGTVLELGMLSTKVRTKRDEEVTLPNAVVLGTGVKNYSRDLADGRLLVHTSVTIGYDTPWRQVEAMLLEAAARTRGVARDADAFVLKTALHDFYVEYQLNVPLADPAGRNALLSTLHGHVLDVFNEHGVAIMSPNYEGDPAEAKLVPRERWYLAPARPPARDEPGAPG